MQLIIKESQIFVPYNNPQGKKYIVEQSQYSSSYPLGVKTIRAFQSHTSSVYKMEIDNNVFYICSGLIYGNKFELVAGYFKINPKIVNTLGLGNSVYNFDASICFISQAYSSKLVKKLIKECNAVALPDSIFRLLTSAPYNFNNIPRETIEGIIGNFLETKYNIPNENIIQGEPLNIIIGDTLDIAMPTEPITFNFRGNEIHLNEEDIDELYGGEVVQIGNLELIEDRGRLIEYVEHPF